MKYVVCETCGTEFMASKKGARFCSHLCANQKNGATPRKQEHCPHNNHVVCSDYRTGKCASCGWNPVVAEERSALLRQKMREALA